MESAVAVPRRLSLRLPAVGWDAVAAWVTSFGLVLYLSLRGGGFDPIVRGQIGVLIWWVVLLVAAAGLLPRLTRQGWAAVGLLAALAAVAALGISDGLSHERALSETARVVAYLGVLLLALTLQGRAGARHVLNGVAAAIGVVTVLAVLSRLHPQAFPHQQIVDFLPGVRRRLAYPLNYWNGLAAFMGMGAVLLLGVAATARRVWAQALAAAVLPLTMLGVYLCVSRGGTVVLVGGVLLFLALTSDRLPSVLTVLAAGAGGALLISAASQRDAVKTGLDTAAARSQGAGLLGVCLVVCAGVALVQVAIALAARHGERPRWLVASPRVTGVAALLGLAVAAAAFAASPLPGDLSDSWHRFKQNPETATAPSLEDSLARLSSSDGQGRWQMWSSAMDAYRSDRTSGIGGGGYQLWWPAHASFTIKVDDAHSLYAQTLAEFGLPGGILLLVFVGLTLIGGGLRAVRAGPWERPLLAGAVAAIAVFWVDALVEWTWQIAAIPVALMFLVAAVLGARRPDRPGIRWPARAAVVGLSVAALVAVALPLAEATQLRRSQDEARSGNYSAALAAARSAAKLQPSAAGPRLQQALVLEATGDLRAAEAAARRATSAEPDNWTTWLTTARLQARLRHTQAALASFRRARALNPRGTIFNRYAP